MKKLIVWLLIVACMPVAAQEKDHNFDVAKNMDVFNAIYKNLDLMYVDTLNANEVIGNGINAMLKSLDPYSVYYPEDQTKDLKEMFTGKFAGVGALIRYNQKIKYTVVEEPYKGMPATEAGLRKGDIILSVDDESMAGRDTKYVSDHLRGDAGTSFILKYKRPSTGKTTKVKITRQVIQEPAIPYYGIWKGDIGYLNLHQFTEGCAKEMRLALIDMKNKGMKKLVFDLRNNTGGSEEEAVDVVNLLVSKGITVASNRGKLKRVNHDFKTTVEPVDSLMPVVVLVNDMTASSSEITSGALQDLDRAVILGSRTYGKGLVQSTVDLPYNGSLKFTTHKYYIPSGRCIQAVNYNHAKGGYVEHVPDSLTKVFYTLHGRVVRDGGGIKPDVELAPDTMSNLAAYLNVRDSTESMLDYEVDYIAAHPTIADPMHFEITDPEFADFKQRVIKNGFTYDQESEKYLNDLEKLVRFEGYYEGAKNEFENLRKKLKHDLSKDLDFNKEELKHSLASDIITAYYYQAGAVQYNLRYDKQMTEAVRLLNAPDEYAKILRPAAGNKKN